MVVRIRPQKTIRIVFVLVWLAAIVSGARYLLMYENTPAEAAQPPDRWPTSSNLLRPNHRFTLIMLAHPNCPCTRASLAELEIIMAELHERVAAFVLFSKPGATADEIHESALWKKASSIPGVSLMYDSEGVEGRRFHGEVSGQTMLYGPDGTLLFSGGITSARGHQGDNEGADTIVRFVNDGGSKSRQAPVFGCALRNPNSQTLKEEPSWRK